MLSDRVRESRVFEFIRHQKNTFFSGGHDFQPGNVDVSHDIILYIENISVSFDGFKALNDLTLYIGDRELRCIIGVLRSTGINQETGQPEHHYPKRQTARGRRRAIHRTQHGPGVWAYL